MLNTVLQSQDTPLPITNNGQCYPLRICSPLLRFDVTISKAGTTKLLCFSQGPTLRKNNPAKVAMEALLVLHK